MQVCKYGEKFEIKVSVRAAIKNTAANRRLIRITLFFSHCEALAKWVLIRSQVALRNRLSHRREPGTASRMITMTAATSPQMSTADHAVALLAAASGSPGYGVPPFLALSSHSLWRASGRSDIAADQAIAQAYRCCADR